MPFGEISKFSALGASAGAVGLGEAGVGEAGAVWAVGVGEDAVVGGVEEPLQPPNHSATPNKITQGFTKRSIASQSNQTVALLQSSGSGNLIATSS